MCINIISKRVSFVFTLLFISNFLLAQSISVSGTITDESNEGMPGVTVKEINGKATSTTDLEGFYKIQVDQLFWNEQKNLLAFFFYLQL